MAAPAIQIFHNDEKVKVYWVSDRTGAYRSWNLYWSLDAGMAGEALVASHISNVPDTTYSKHDVIYEFDRASIGVAASQDFYVRLKGVSGAGVEDVANPGPSKIIHALFPSVEEYHAIQLYGWNSEKNQWKRLSTADDGSLSAHV